MTEEKKGHAKITVEFELNEALMELIKESAKNMPQMGETMRKMFQGERKEQKKPSAIDFVCSVAGAPREIQNRLKR